jgi:serine protease AprX
LRLHLIVEAEVVSTLFMARTFFFITAVLFCLPFVDAQVSYRKYLVQFKDKGQSPFSIMHAQHFLSPKALERRALARIPIDSTDLPVSPVYQREVEKYCHRLMVTSRWLNCVGVFADSVQIKQIAALPFVMDVQYFGPFYGYRFPAKPVPKQRFTWPETPKANQGFENLSDGYAAVQQQLTGASWLRTLFLATGQDMSVAVMDGGYNAVDTTPFFAHMDLRRGIVSTRDFVEQDDYVYEASGHGAAVFSTMAGDVPSYYRAAATDAEYHLLMTEDTNGEFPIEELNWVAGAEYADSIGVDVINASLGYTSFNDSSLNHTYRDLNGKSSIGARGASIAARKGMMICNAAGNSGDEPWRHIGVPADAPGIITVGATDPYGRYASFSSVGPTSDGRIKPDLSVPGHQVVAMSGNGLAIQVGSGTSYASPILAAGLTALWSAFKDKTAEEVLGAVFRSASQNDNPDTLLGYGVPSFFHAFADLQGTLMPAMKDGLHYYLQSVRTAQSRQSALLFLSETLTNAEAIEAVQFTTLAGKEVTYKVGSKPTDCRIGSESGIVLYLNWPEWQGVAGLVKCELIFAEGGNLTTYFIFN